MGNPIIAALDRSSPEEALVLAQSLAGDVGGFKIGSELFTNAGPDIVRKVRALGNSVFLDLKFHDIPTTVAKAVAAAVALDVQMLTVHTSGGSAMLKAAEESAQATAAKLNKPPPLVLGVTILTSFDSDELSEIGMVANVGNQVERLATLAVSCGLRGLVCSPLELVVLRQIVPSSIQLVTPGIRSGPKSDDQKRTLSAPEAIEFGANWLVIGRPICSVPNPVAAAKGIYASLKKP